MTTHLMFDGRLQVYRRGDGIVWQCAARVGGERHRNTTKEENLDRAKDVAEEWYLDLRGKLRNGEIVKRERKFGEAAEHYLRQMRVLAPTVRSPLYVKYAEQRLKKHVLPFFGSVSLSEVNRGLTQSYRVKRAEDTIALTKTDERPGKPPARSTISQEMVLVRQVLKHAEGMGWLSHIPNLSMPYMTQGKRERRAWFSPDEYNQLYKAVRRRIAAGTRRGWKEHYEDLLDLVLLFANTGLRPDEMMRLEFRDVSVEEDPYTDKPILVIDVRGKTGVGFCKSMPGAVFPFERLRYRRQQQLAKPKGPKAKPRKLQPNDRLFPLMHRDLFNEILREEGLKHDRDGRPRTFYSLRHTYISMRLMEGADVYQLANNCRTSVQMIEQHYAAHIKDRVDTRAINVMRPTKTRAALKRAAARKKPQSLEGDSFNL